MINRMTAPLVGLSLCLAAAAPVSAQDYSFQVAGAEQTVEVEVSSAVTLAFDTPFGEMSMGDPEIADLSLLSDTLVYVLGKTVGKTTMTVIRDAKQLDLTHVTVIAYRDIAPMQSFLGSAAKGVSLVRDGVTVTVSGCIVADREEGAVETIVTQLKDWGYVTLVDVGRC